MNKGKGTFFNSCSISPALMTIGPRTAYSMFFTWGLMLAAVKTFHRRHSGGSTELGSCRSFRAVLVTTRSERNILAIAIHTRVSSRSFTEVVQLSVIKSTSPVFLSSPASNSKTWRENTSPPSQVKVATLSLKRVVANISAAFRDDDACFKASRSVVICWGFFGGRGVYELRLTRKSEDRETQRREAKRSPKVSDLKVVSSRQEVEPHAGERYVYTFVCVFVRVFFFFLPLVYVTDIILWCKMRMWHTYMTWCRSTNVFTGHHMITIQWNLG